MTGQQVFDEFLDLLKDFETAMLVTRTGAGRLRARPMAIAEVSGQGDLQFATRIDSPKVEEITSDSNVAVVCQKDGRYLSLSGKAMIVNDPEQIERCFQEAWQQWFPAGAKDPALRLLRVLGIRGQYWKEGSESALEFVWEAGKAVLGGETGSDRAPAGVKVDLKDDRD